MNNAVIRCLFIICCITNISAQELDNDISMENHEPIEQISPQDISESSQDAQTESSNDVVANEPVLIEQAKKDITVLMNRQFEFEELPEYITANAKRDFYISVGMELLEYLAETFPQSDRYTLAVEQLGNYYYDQENYQKAMAYLEIYCEQTKDTEKLSIATYKLGHVYQEIEEYEKAIKTFFRVIDYVQETDDTAFRAYKEVARSYRLLGNTKKEILTYENASNFFTDPEKSANFLLLIAKTHLHNQNYFDAQWNLEKVVKEYSDSQYIYETLYLLAQTYDKTDDTAKERKTLTDIINKRSNDNAYITRALFALGDSYYSKEEYKDAAIAYYTALKQDSEDIDITETLSRLARCYVELELYDLALDTFQELLDKGLDTKKKTKVFFEIAKINFEQQRYKESLKSLENVLLNQSILSEKRIDTLYLLAMNQFHLKNFRESFETFLQIKHQSDNQVFVVRSMFMLGTILKEIEKFQSAAQYYNEVLNTYNALINTEYQETEQEEQPVFLAEPDKNELMQIKIDTLFALANGYFERSEYQKSIGYYTQLNKLDIPASDKAWSLYRTGKCSENIGNFDKAKEMFQRVETEFPGIEIARQAVWDTKNIDWRKSIPRFSENNNTP